MALATGLSAEVRRVVASYDTASAVGSGDVPVLATPRLVGWMEIATVAALRGHLDTGTTTVGSRIAVDHLVPSAVETSITITTELVGIDGRSLRFSVTAVDDAARTVATGEVVRVIVDRERFLGRVRSR
jgi:predicted thioesterase